MKDNYFNIKDVFRILFDPFGDVLEFGDRGDVRPDKQDEGSEG